MQWFVLAGLLVASAVVAAVGSVFTSSAMPEWYMSLEKPAFNPPSWVFGPVWTVLYIMMAVSAWLVWRASGFRRAATALTVYAVQLMLNLAWSGIFFGLREPGWALLEILVLWAAIVATIALFHSHSRVAAWLLVPYLLWVSFAAVLNGAIWRLN